MEERTMATDNEGDKEPCPGRDHLVRMEAGSEDEENNKKNSGPDRGLIAVEFKVHS